MDTNAATQAMIDNLPAKTGRTLQEWFVVLDSACPGTHGASMALLKGEHGVTHGYANLIATKYRSRHAALVSGDDLIEAQYSGSKATLRPVCDRIVAAARDLGEDVEVAPKKTGVSLRRSKQFALVEVPSSKRVQLGLNLRGEPGTERLRETSGMCTHRVDLSGVDDIDDELVRWLRAAYDRA